MTDKENRPICKHHFVYVKKEQEGTYTLKGTTIREYDVVMCEKCGLVVRN